jgi:hypothetical protein
MTPFVTMRRARNQMRGASLAAVLEHFPFTLHRILLRRGSWRILAG